MPPVRENVRAAKVAAPNPTEMTYFRQNSARWHIARFMEPVGATRDGDLRFRARSAKESSRTFP
jgi:hypothetical protein